MNTTQEHLSPGVLEALSIGNLPDMEWSGQDDLCDCTFQRIGLWKNPYFAESLEVRWCCVWAKLLEQFPDAVRTIPGYWNENTKTWMTEAWAWDGEEEMPKSHWYRHLARKLDRPLAEIRAEYAQKDELRPKGRGQSKPLWIQLEGTWRCLNLASRRTVGREHGDL